MRRKMKRKEVVKSLTSLKEKLQSQLQHLTQAPSTEAGQQGEARALAQRVKNATSALHMQVSANQKVRKASARGCVDLYWLSRLYDCETALMWKGLAIKELEERQKLLARLANQFKALLPPSLAGRLQQAEQNPGEIIVDLNRMASQNRDKAKQLLELDEEVEMLRNSCYEATIAHENASALEALSRFECAALQNPSSGLAAIPPLGPDFGLHSLQKLEGNSRTLKAENEAISQGLEALRARTIQAVNAIEKGRSGSREASSAIRECEKLLAAHVADRLRRDA